MNSEFLMPLEVVIPKTIKIALFWGKVLINAEGLKEAIGFLPDFAHYTEGLTVFCEELPSDGEEN